MIFAFRSILQILLFHLLNVFIVFVFVNRDRPIHIKMECLNIIFLLSFFIAKTRNNIAFSLLVKLIYK